MSAQEQKKKNKPIWPLIVMGAASLALYVALLMNQDFFNNNFAKGGLYAFLPILTAFIFSFVHGNFTGHFWSVLGVEASKKRKEVK